MEEPNNSFYAFKGEQFFKFKFDGKLKNSNIINLPEEF